MELTNTKGVCPPVSLGQFGIPLPSAAVPNDQFRCSTRTEAKGRGVNNDANM
jgi:hypothetical protein